MLTIKKPLNEKIISNKKKPNSKDMLNSPQIGPQTQITFSYTKNNPERDRDNFLKINTKNRKEYIIVRITPTKKAPKIKINKLVPSKIISLEKNPLVNGIPDKHNKHKKIARLIKGLTIKVLKELRNSCLLSPL
jgi:hypothetical protein